MSPVFQVDLYQLCHQGQALNSVNLPYQKSTYYEALVKAMVFPVVMYGYESWIVKKVSTEELMLLNCDVGEDS